MVTFGMEVPGSLPRSFQVDYGGNCGALARDPAGRALGTPELTRSGALGPPKPAELAILAFFLARTWGALECSGLCLSLGARCCRCRDPRCETATWRGGVAPASRTRPGNISSAVGPYAIDKGYLTIAPGETHGGTGMEGGRNGQGLGWMR